MVSVLGQADCKEERASGTAHSGLNIYILAPQLGVSSSYVS